VSPYLSTEPTRIRPAGLYLYVPDRLNKGHILYIQNLDPMASGTCQASGLHDLTAGKRGKYSFCLRLHKYSRVERMGAGRQFAQLSRLSGSKKGEADRPAFELGMSCKKKTHPCARPGSLRGGDRYILLHILLYIPVSQTQTSWAQTEQLRPRLIRWLPEKRGVQTTYPCTHVPKEQLIDWRSSWCFAFRGLGVGCVGE
jgi:hypothetical protein